MTRARATLLLLAAIAIHGVPVAQTVDPPCVGRTVAAGADIVSIVNGGAPGETFCVAAGTFSIGERSLMPKSGMKIIGAPVLRSARGELSAPTKIVGTSPNGIVHFRTEASNVLLENLDISGATGTKNDADGTTKRHGRGVNGNTGQAIDLTVRSCRIHHNANAGIGGAGVGLLVDRCELLENGSASYLGCCSGGVKSAAPMTVVDSYVHHNVGTGIWQDVCGYDLVVERNRVESNTQGGIRYEHGMECPGSARIWNNVVRLNNTSRNATSAGIEINSAPDADVAFNTLGGNPPCGIKVYGARGSTEGTWIHGNVLNGDRVCGCDRPDVVCER